MVNKFTQKARSALSSALSIAEELGHSYIGTEHLLLGLIGESESIASRILTNRGADPSKIKNSIIEYMGVGTKSTVSPEDMTPRLHFIIESAARESEKNRIKYVGTEHLLSALLNRRDCVALRLLENEGVCISEVKADLAAYLGSSPYKHSDSPSPTDEKTQKAKKGSLLSYGKDLTEAARQGLTDPVLCRHQETARLIRILCRRTKNNPCLIGEPGVGKTAIVEGLAHSIAYGKVPPELLNKRIITLDISSMIAGAKFRGEFEDRIKNVIDEVKSDPSIILFVDEMHVMVGAGAAEGAIDAANILKPALSRGEIRMIGATTPTEYRAHIEKDSALERRFQPVMLSEPTEAEAIEMLKGLREKYEKHHCMEISDEAISSAVKLSIRYIHDRFLPDKAIDLIDEAAARLKLSLPMLSYTSAYSLPNALGSAKEDALKRKNFSEAAKICDEERKLRESSVSLITPESVLEKTVLRGADVAAVISEHTGIPYGELSTSDDQRLSELHLKLSQKIIGQEEAITAVSNAIRRGKSGLCDPNRPIGSFLFLGSSGVGKTELCRALAEILFERADSLIRFDMSEYMEKHSISKLIGAPPGYVGYGEGGLLTEKVRRHPYSVVLFDEIEKAHPDVLHLLLQILENGSLTDSIGKKADFSSTVVVMTSNAVSSDQGARSLGFSEGLQESDNNLRMHKSLREYFKPELLNRIDEIILFRSLNKKELLTISRLMLDDLCRRAADSGIVLSIDQDVAQLLADNCYRDHKNDGARPLRREIQKLVETPLAELLVSSPSAKTTTIRIHVGGEHISLEPTKEILLN